MRLIDTLSAQERTVYDEVQAALLNSECDPIAAMRVAFRAVADFAAAEGLLADEPVGPV
jgi:hypothetical protein